jgi:ketosteroid isomerase-like protein
MLEQSPLARGKEAIRTTIGTLMQDPAFALTFEPDRVVAARSDDLAYETGSYSLMVSDPDGNPQTQTGHYAVVWEKQTDGSWKAEVDVPVSGPPTEAPAP